MAKRSALYPAGYGSYQGGVGTLDQARGNVLLPPNAGGSRWGLDFTSAHTWAWIWFAGAVAYLLIIYNVHGGRRGGAL